MTSSHLVSACLISHFWPVGDFISFTEIRPSTPARRRRAGVLSLICIFIYLLYCVIWSCIALAMDIFRIYDHEWVLTVKICNSESESFVQLTKIIRTYFKSRYLEHIRLCYESNFAFSFHLEVDFNTRTDIFPSIHLWFSFCKQWMTIYIYPRFLLSGNARGDSWSFVFGVFRVPERNRRPIWKFPRAGRSSRSYGFVLSRLSPILISVVVYTLQ